MYSITHFSWECNFTDNNLDQLSQRYWKFLRNHLNRVMLMKNIKGCKSSLYGEVRYYSLSPSDVRNIADNHDQNDEGHHTHCYIDSQLNLVVLLQHSHKPLLCIHYFSHFLLLIMYMYFHIMIQLDLLRFLSNAPELMSIKLHNGSVNIDRQIEKIANNINFKVLFLILFLMQYTTT